MDAITGNGPAGADARQSHAVPGDAWEQPEMRAALAGREVSAVYRLLRKHGVSQRQIAAMTGQSQSEVSEILKGRQVMAYDVLTRIADGLGVPRGYMGLAYDEVTANRVVGTADGQQAEEDESVKRRRFLAHAALHSLAGWTSFDTGLMDSARGHFANALDLAKQGENHPLVANVLYRMG